MKKRIIISVLVTVIFASIILSSVFVAMVNINEIDRTKEMLSLYNKLIISEWGNDNLDLSQYKVNGEAIRFTVIDKSGKVIYDTLNEKLDNHGDRKEIISAFTTGTGSAVRGSQTLQKQLVYFATKVNDNLVIRSSSPVDDIRIFTVKSSVYFILIVIGVIALSVALSGKLVKIIVQPVTELERVAYKVANGDLNKRAVVYYKDEIGSLARTFNEMADQLELRINDSLEKQTKLEAILESLESGVIAITTNGKVMLINPYAKSLFGINEDVIGKDISNYIIDHELLDFIRDIVDINAEEIKLYHPVEREIKVKKAPIIGKSNKKIGVVISIQDISDIKRLENMRSEFVANVSHELKTPLTSIKGFSETLRIVEDDNTKNKFLDIIDKETDRLNLLINDILILSNLENMNKMVEDKFEPNETINEVINMIKKEAAKKEINIECNLKFKGLLIGDKNKFYQVVLNLVTNGIKYSKNYRKINIYTNESKGKFILVVKDNGIGIPREDLPRIFERFYRVDKSRTSKGTGLGLAIVKHIVKLFNGDIFVESKINEGSKFTVIIRNMYKEEI